MRYALQRVFVLIQFTLEVLLAGVLQAGGPDVPSFPANREMWYRYAVANPTDGVVKILGVRASCSCVEAECGKNELRPGETTELTVVWSKYSSVSKMP